MQDNDLYWASIASNTNTETVGGIIMPKVRAIEESDPVYYQIDDSMGKDLKERDIALANAVQVGLGGWFNQFMGPNTLFNDIANPFEYGTVAGRGVTCDFLPTMVSKAYFQFAIANNVKLTENLYFKLIYCMSTSETGKSVGLTFRYDIVQSGDAYGSPTVTQTNNETLSVPNAQFVMNGYTSVNFMIPIAQMGVVTNHSIIVCSIERDVSVPNNHAGKFQLAGIIVYQP
jgi:hypothetical protein